MREETDVRIKVNKNKFCYTYITETKILSTGKMIDISNLIIITYTLLIIFHFKNAALENYINYLINCVHLYTKKYEISTIRLHREWKN